MTLTLTLPVALTLMLTLVLTVTLPLPLILTLMLPSDLLVPACESDWGAQCPPTLSQQDTHK